MTPAPTTVHQAVSRDLLVILHNHVATRGLGAVYCAPIDVILAPTTVVQPDLVFIAAAHTSIITKRAIEAAPDLLVEILSPSSVRQDRVTKAALYARFGIPHYWVVDADACTLEEYALAESGYRLTATHRGAAVVRTAAFPDLDLDLSRVWA